MVPKGLEAKFEKHFFVEKAKAIVNFRFMHRTHSLFQKDHSKDSTRNGNCLGGMDAHA